MDLFQRAECEVLMAFHEAWDSITKIEIEVDSYDDLIMKSGIPPFPMGNVGEGMSPEQMEWMLRYGQRIDPAMPQRAMAHLGGPFVAPRSKAVFVNPVNPNKVFKLNAGATLPIAFSHALAAMGYPVAPMTPMATFNTPNEYEDNATTSVVGQDRFDVVPSIGEGRRKSWPEGGDAYFDDYTWMDMFRDNIAGSKFAGTDVPEGSAPQWFDPESDTIRGMEFLQRRGVDVQQWAKDFMRANREDPAKFKPKYGKDTPQGRLVQALNDELRRYRELEIQPGYDRFPNYDTGELKRYDNISGNEWEDPFLSWLQFQPGYGELGPNVGLDETGRPMLTSFGIRGSPTMRVGNYGVAETSSDYQPMLKPRKEKGVEDGWDRAARRMFGQPIKARTVKFEKDPVYGLLRPVYGTAMRPQTKGGYLGALDAETGEKITIPRRLPHAYGRTFEDVVAEDPRFAPLFGTSEDGVDISRAYKFAEMLQGFPAYEDEEGDMHYDSYGSEKRGDEEARRIYQMTRKPDDDHDLIWGRPQPENFKHQTEAEAEADENAWAGDSYEGRMKRWLRRHGGEPTPEMIEAARERYASLDPDWDSKMFPGKRYPHWQFHLKDTLRDDPLMRYLSMNPGKEAILPINRVRGFNTPGNDDEAGGLFPFPMPMFFDPNQNIYQLGREYDGQSFGGVKVPFNDGSGREFPPNFRMLPDRPSRMKEFEHFGQKGADGEWESPFTDAFEEAWSGQVEPKKLIGAGQQWQDPQMANPNTDFIRTIGALHDHYPLPQSTRLAELLENMPDRSLFDANPKQQRIYDKFMKVFPKDVEFWQAMSDNPLMSNEEAFGIYNRLRDSYDD